MTAVISQERADQIFREYQSYLPVLLPKRPQGVPVLSASQIERYVQCKRYWALEYLYGVRSPQKASAELGDKVHKLLEDWLREAKPITGDSREAKIARMMVRFLPQPGSGVPERKFYFRTRHGHHYSGRMDWSGVLYDALYQLIVVGIDHKTTANYADTYKRNKRGEMELWRGYGKTEADLHVDIQATIYAIALFVGFETSLAELFWNYGETKKESENPQVVPVKTRVHLPIVFAKFDQVIEPIAAEIILLHQQRPIPHPFAFPPTVTACDAFGGCPHQDYCNISEQERLYALMNQPVDNSMAGRMAGAFPPGFNGAPPGFGQQPGFPQQQPPVGFQTPQQQGGPPPFVPGQQMPQQGFPQQYPQQGGPQQQQPQQYPQQGFPQQGGFPQQQQGGFGAPPGFAPPGIAPQQQQMPPGGFQPPPGAGPNAPEAGGQLPQEPEGEEGGKGKGRGRGRPAGSKNKELGIEDEIYMRGVAAMISNPSWDHQQGSLQAAGESALAVMRLRLG